MLVVGEWGQYTVEETSIRIVGKKLYIKGEKGGKKVLERLDLPEITIR